MKKFKHIFGTIIILIIIFSFVQSNSEMIKIRVEITMPDVGISAKKEFIFREMKTFSIYYFGRHRVYEFPVYSLDDKGNQSISSKKSYFIHEQGKKYGILYLIYNPKGSKVLVDSVLRLRAFQGNDAFFEHNDTTFINRRVLSNDIIEESFVPKLKKDRTYPDTVYHYYSDKLANIEYSFSKKVDIIKQSKLFKCRGIFNSQVYKGDTIKLPRREFLVEMKGDIVTDDNKDAVTKILNKYNTDSN